jgi:hypothetical protein
MDEAQEIAEFVYGLEGFQDTLSPRGRSTTFARGSRNLIPDDDLTARPFYGIQLHGQGARVMALAGDTWAGLADTEDQQAAGSIFSWFADMLIYAGYGQVVYGANLIPDQFASSLVQFLLRWGGSYEEPESGPFVAGLPQPGAPTVGIIDTLIGGVPQTNGSYSIKFAWIRTTTGGRSIASATSATVVAQGKGVYAIVGEAPEGATHGVFFITKTNFAGRGLHYRLVRANPYTGIEYTVADIERSLSDVTVTNGSPNIGSASGDFTAADVGKKFSPVSAGFTVPAGTVIQSVTSPTAAILSNNVTVSSGTNPRTAKVISFVAGFERSVLLNWQESDLTDEDAWTEDHPPPPASHVFPLEKVLGVVSDTDSFDLASGENRGTAFHFSLRNLPESFNPLHVLYSPQKVVDVLHRGLDSYVFFSCKMFTGAIQFIDIEGSAPATLTALLPNEGISSRNNWCADATGIYMFTAKGVPIVIGENGVVNRNIGKFVRKYMKNWTEREKVVVANYSDGVSISWTYKNETLLLNTQTGLWSSPLALYDYVPEIEVVAALGVDGRVLMSATAEEDGDLGLYEFDAAQSAVFAAIPHYQTAPDAKKTKIINSLAPQFNADRLDRKVYVSVHVNDAITHVTDAAMDDGDDVLVSTQVVFDASMLGDYVLVKGAGPTSMLRGRIIQILAPDQVKIGTCERVLANCISLKASETVTNAYCVIAKRIYEYTPTRLGINNPPPKEIFVNGVKSYAVGMIMESAGEGFATPLSCSVAGTVNPEKTWRSF